MRILFPLLLLFSHPALAYLTSDFDVAMGLTSIDFKTAGNSANLNSLATTNFSYNLNYAAWNTSINMIFEETPTSSQGNMAWTRLAMGARYYPTGFNALRVIFDSKVEGHYWRPAPFVGLSLGFSSFAIESLSTGGTEGNGYFNAATMDLDFRAGAEVVITNNLFLTGQLSLLSGMPAQNSKTGKDLSYTGIGVYAGLKLISF